MTIDRLINLEVIFGQLRDSGLGGLVDMENVPTNFCLRQLISLLICSSEVRYTLKFYIDVSLVCEFCERFLGTRMSEWEKLSFLMLLEEGVSGREVTQLAVRFPWRGNTAFGFSHSYSFLPQCTISDCQNL